ncbi:hypothetical protein VNO78_16926 [Psophocarpus tetragonolobus]|uniref:LOB domain-containing protein n=1 Tax=Psophocarpus tetragonolobus TaxID=3891 RepID=A0AAN9XKX8_PSOTE
MQKGGGDCTEGAKLEQGEGGSNEGSSRKSEKRGSGSNGGKAEALACGACKYMRRKCENECMFAPYFPSEKDSARFAVVHKVFGKNCLLKLLSNVEVDRRHEVMDSLCYQAQARLLDPVYGCVSIITALQQQVALLQEQLAMVNDQLINTEILYETLLQTTQEQQQPNINVAVETAYSNNSSLAPANMMNIRMFNPIHHLHPQHWSFLNPLGFPSLRKKLGFPNISMMTLHISFYELPILLNLSC